MNVFKVSLYGYTMLAAFVLGFGFACRGMRRYGVSGRMIFYSVFLNIVATIYGAKLYTVIHSGFRTNWFSAGFSSLGGALGLLAGVFLFGFIDRQDRERFFHMYALAIPGMYGVSKFGCYTAGCCHGIPYDGPFCVIYQNDVACTGPVFPVQLVECVVFIGIFLAGSRLYGKLQSGRTVSAVMLLCAAAKFLLEYLREEHIGVTISMNQTVCIGFAGWAVWRLLRRGAEDRCFVENKERS